MSLFLKNNKADSDKQSSDSDQDIQQNLFKTSLTQATISVIQKKDSVPNYHVNSFLKEQDPLITIPNPFTNNVGKIVQNGELCGNGLMIKYTNKPFYIKDHNNLNRQILGLIITCAHLSLEFFQDKKKVFFVPQQNKNNLKKLSSLQNIVLLPLFRQDYFDSPQIAKDPVNGGLHRANDVDLLLALAPLNTANIQKFINKNEFQEVSILPKDRVENLKGDSYVQMVAFSQLNKKDQAMQLSNIATGQNRQYVQAKLNQCKNIDGKNKEIIEQFQSIVKVQDIFSQDRRSYGGKIKQKNQELLASDYSVIKGNSGAPIFWCDQENNVFHFIGVNHGAAVCIGQYFFNTIKSCVERNLVPPLNIVDSFEDFSKFLIKYNEYAEAL